VSAIGHETPAARALGSAGQKEQARATALENEHLGSFGNNNLQPSGVLNRRAMRGRYSLHDLLVQNDSSDEQQAAAEPEPSTSEDPISLGLVNLAIARSLFDRYVE
jgi:hypothetical protein